MKQRLGRREKALLLAGFSLLLPAMDPSSSFSEESSFPQEAERMEAQAADLQGYRARFVLETKEKSEEPFRVEGTILFQRPNRRRLELWQSASENAEEATQLLISDGAVEWQYYPSDHMVYKATAPLDAPGPHRPFAEVKRETLRFVDRIGTGSNIRLRFEGIPLPSVTEGAPVPIQKLRVDVGQADGLVRELVLLDEKGEAVLTQQYREIELNPQISADTFAFTPPAGAAVVDGANQKGS